MSQIDPDWQEVTSALNHKGIEEIKMGQMLGFLKQGRVKHYKVVRKHKGRIWVIPAYLYRPDQVRIVDKKKELDN